MTEPKRDRRCNVCDRPYEGRCVHPLQSQFSEHMRQRMPYGANFEHKTIYGGFVQGGFCDPRGTMTKLEKVARAIFQESQGDGWLKWEDSTALREAALRQARAAIEAMRLPSEPMVLAASDIFMGAHEPYEESYTAMIDAVLKEIP